MSNLHRLAWIDDRIREGRYPNSRSVAERFEISCRQAQRDIEYLKYTMGAPIEFSAEKKGYYYTDNAFIMPSGFISGEDRKVLSYLAHQYRMTGGGETARLAALFSRLGSGEKEDGGSANALPVIDVPPDEVEICNTLMASASSRSKVEMNYTNNSGETITRVLHPYKLFKRERIDYIAGFCELRNEIRIFRLSRIKILRMLEESFEISPLYNENDYGPGIGFRFREPYTALIEFKSAPEQGKLKPGMLQEGPNLYRISFFSSEEVLSSLLSIASPFTIRFPAWLKDRLKERLKSLLDSNG